MTTIELVKTELENNNLPTTGVYSTLPNMAYNLTLNILYFGESELEKSNLGKGVKTVALMMAKKDGRKPTVCKNTFKTILV